MGLELDIEDSLFPSYFEDAHSYQAVQQHIDELRDQMPDFGSNTIMGDRDPAIRFPRLASPRHFGPDGKLDKRGEVSQRVKYELALFQAEE